LRLFTIAGLAVAAAPVAAAQGSVDLVSQLLQGGRCSATSAKDDLEFNLKKLKDLAGSEIGTALNGIAADEARCAPIRDAAKALAAGYVVVPAPSETEQLQAAAQDIVMQALAEAEARATRLKFEVGPPPRNMTRGRETGR